MAARADITGRRPGRTAATKQAYERRLGQLVARTARRLGIAEGAVTAPHLVQDLDERGQDLAAATVRQYRAAVSYGTETGLISEAASLRERCKWPAGRRRGRQTASLKLKRLDDGDLRRIDHALRRSRSRYARDLRAFLLANRIIGARVCEWRDAVYLDRHPETGAPALRLRNGKATNARGNGAHRTLHLAGLSADARSTVATCARWLARRETDGTFGNWQDGAAKLLNRTCRKIWPRRRRHITLYSTRHAFVAGAKAHHPRSHVAALLGHRSVSTAAVHYARTARRGRRPAPGMLPKADSAEVARITDPPADRRPRAGPPEP